MSLQKFLGGMVFVCLSALPSFAAYDQPSKDILEVMQAPSPPAPLVSPTKDSILLVYWQDYPSIARVSAPFLRLAGVRLEPKNHSKHDTPGGYGITPCARAFEIVHLEKDGGNGLKPGSKTAIKLPQSACPGTPIWSADGQRFAFVNRAAESVELWTGDAKTGSVHRKSSNRPTFQFMKSQVSLA